MYDCSGYFSAPADSDSISIDSLDIDEIDPYTAVDQWGNPIDSYDENEDSEAQPEPTESENTEATKED